MNKQPNFNQIVAQAWQDYDASRPVSSITDISAKVSTNHVFLIKLEDRSNVIGKLSYFGKYEQFVEDHALINALSINLTDPYDQFISRSLTKYNELYTFRYQDDGLDIWVVFYNPIRIKNQLPPILSETQIKKLGREVAKFHLACNKVRNILPSWSKTLRFDIDQLLKHCSTKSGEAEYLGNIDTIKNQIDLFYQNMGRLGAEEWSPVPVFVDWNIGNFSIDNVGRFFSRWDYDWFRMSSRVFDFYFFSRVCSSVGDKTVFSYLIDTVNEDRFVLFLKEYHKIYPLTRNEILFIKEAYRFFILNYVIKDGRYFFNDFYATKLQREAYEIYLPRIDDFDDEKLLKALKL